MRACRRRNHTMDIDDTSVRGIFDIQDSYRLLRMRAIFSKIKLHIASFGMAPFDAYRAMDTNRDGKCQSFINFAILFLFLLFHLWNVFVDFDF